MTLLEHLEELRSRLLKAVIGFIVAFVICWGLRHRLLEWIVAPIREHLFESGEIVFI